MLFIKSKLKSTLCRVSIYLSFLPSPHISLIPEIIPRNLMEKFRWKWIVSSKYRKINSYLYFEMKVFIADLVCIYLENFINKVRKVHFLKNNYLENSSNYKISSNGAHICIYMHIYAAHLMKFCSLMNFPSYS